MNGVTGTVRSILPDPDDPVVEVHFEGQEDNSQIGRVEATFERSGLVISRKQFPLVPAYAVTVHKWEFFYFLIEKIYEVEGKQGFAKRTLLGAENKIFTMKNIFCWICMSSISKLFHVELNTFCKDAMWERVSGPKA